VNEDVVIPLPRMGDYCDGIERINIELSTQNKLALCDALTGIPAGRTAAACRRRQPRPDELIGDRREAGPRATRRQVRRRWQWLLDNLDLPLAEAEPQFADYGVVAGELTNRAANPTSSTACRITRRTCLEDRTALAPRQDLRRQRCSRRCWKSSKAIHKEMLRGRVFVALHMHAGDGNVHTNIPVNSDNYEMLQTANQRWSASWRWPALGGVISGEHGIGITKLDYLTDEEMAPSAPTSSGRSRKAASTAAS
jgi:FAD/FMN-containing dehydrogenase